MKKINCKPTETEIFIWNILGSLSNSLLSMITLMLVTRMLDSGKTDIFSIGWSISQLMATIGTFQIRTYQATDVNETFKFGQYLIFRIITSAGMIVCSVGYIFIKHYDTYKGTIILIICLFRVVDSLADVYEGYFQQKERLDLAGKAVTYRIVVAVVGFFISLFFIRNLFISCMILLGSYVICFFGYDVRYSIKVDQFNVKESWKKKENWIWKLVKEGTPIFVNAFLMMAITNAPKMKIDLGISVGQLNDGAQTIFNILFMPASVLTLAYIVFRPLLTKMAIAWANREKNKFLKIIIMMLVCLLAMAIVLVIGSALIGIPVLTFLYAVPLEEYRTELLVMIVGGCFCTFSYVLDNALIVIRKQHLLVCSYVVSWIYIETTVSFFVDKWKLMGAAMAYASSMMVFFGVTLFIFFICLKKESTNE